MITASGSDDGTATPIAELPKLPVSVDTKGRVRVTKEQRRAILAEFARIHTCREITSGKSLLRPSR